MGASLFRKTTTKTRYPQKRHPHINTIIPICATPHAYHALTRLLVAPLLPLYEPFLGVSPAFRGSRDTGNGRVPKAWPTTTTSDQRLWRVSAGSKFFTTLGTRMVPKTLFFAATLQKMNRTKIQTRQTTCQELSSFAALSILRRPLTVETVCGLFGNPTTKPPLGSVRGKMTLLVLNSCERSRKKTHATKGLVTWVRFDGHV